MKVQAKPFQTTLKTNETKAPEQPRTASEAGSPGTRTPSRTTAESQFTSASQAPQTPAASMSPARPRRSVTGGLFSKIQHQTVDNQDPVEPGRKPTNPLFLEAMQEVYDEMKTELTYLTAAMTAATALGGLAAWLFKEKLARKILDVTYRMMFMKERHPELT